MNITYLSLHKERREIKHLISLERASYYGQAPYEAFIIELLAWNEDDVKRSFLEAMLAEHGIDVLQEAMKTELEEAYTAYSVYKSSL